MKCCLSILLGMICLLHVAVCSAQSVEDESLPQTVVDGATAFWKNKDLGRYMEHDHCPTIEDRPNWKGFKLQQCTYSSSNQTATVLMLNPSREILIKWAVASCAMKYGVSNDALLATCTGHVLHWVFLQSGSQFVVAGLVIESAQGAYSFRDGLSVKLKGFRWVDSVNKNYQKASFDNAAAIDEYGNKPRIASTQRSWYANFETQYLHRQPTDTKGANYLPVIRELYQDAWRRANDQTLPETVGKYRNDLIAAYHFQ